MAGESGEPGEDVSNRCSVVAGWSFPAGLAETQTFVSFSELTLFNNESISRYHFAYIFTHHMCE